MTQNSEQLTRHNFDKQLYAFGRHIRDKSKINLKEYKNAKPKASMQMATGSGKIFTAITFIYRLLKYAKAKRILFRVERKNLSKQAEPEFMRYVPDNDNQKVTQLYGVPRLKSSFIPADNQLVISTIQRLHSILKGIELDESRGEPDPNEYKQEVLPLVIYREKIPIEFFDFFKISRAKERFVLRFSNQHWTFWKSDSNF